MSVALVHASLVIMLRCIDNFIRLTENVLVYFYVRLFPAARLLLAGQNQNQPDMRVLLFGFQYSQRRQGIKALYAAAPK